MPPIFLGKHIKALHNFHNSDFIILKTRGQWDPSFNKTENAEVDDWNAVNIKLCWYLSIIRLSIKWGNEIRMNSKSRTGFQKRSFIKINTYVPLNE
jgi:hypothetical protein